MKFCSLCGSLCSKTIQSGELVFSCICTNKEEVTPKDTLMASGIIASSQDLSKHQVLIENASLDFARKLVAMKCKCGLDSMTMTRIGDENTIIYTCKCGEKIII